MGRAKMSNKYEIAFAGAFTLFSSERAFCINFSGKRNAEFRIPPVHFVGRERRREGECVGRQGLQQPPTLTPALALLRRGARRKEEDARGRRFGSEKRQGEGGRERERV